ncbi:MAG: hypothetical protein A2Z71_11600 [Chloroflexi bacterium RBG_13_50_21]|nr:MAG: hypothetical protein A2Z71_11600 [Chloroflexi bacterium RBG_13_50_21]
MNINWDEVQKIILPIKDYEDLCRRLQESFAFPFVHQTFNFSMPQLIDYTQKLLGGDARGRYTEYASGLIKLITDLYQAGVQNVVELKERTASREKLEVFTEQSRVSANDIVSLLKYLIYWFIPNEKYLSGLVRADLVISEAVRVLGGLGVRTNLQLLQAGITAARRRSLSDSSGLPYIVISELVNRADFSRLPWASKATISNIIGAGYGSLAQLANANPEQLYTDFFRYGNSIGKNLKLGNEIENSYRIAKIVPGLLQND